MEFSEGDSIKIINPVTVFLLKQGKGFVTEYYTDYFSYRSAKTVYTIKNKNNKKNEIHYNFECDDLQICRLILIEKKLKMFR